MSIWETVGQSNEWYTPAYIFDALSCEFDLDVAAPKDGPRHVPAKKWLWCNGLTQEWGKRFVWMNPPFGGRNGLEPWLEKFINHGNGIALTPDRTSAPWFQYTARRVDAVLFVSPKIKFERPDGSIGKWPGTGTALHAIGDRAVEALLNADGLIGTVMRRSNAQG